MPLNRVEGENLPIIGRGKVVPIEKWGNVLDFWQIASGHAAVHFAKAGAPVPITISGDDALVMEYHILAKVVWLFQHDIRGETHYYPYTFDLGPLILPELIAEGLWPGTAIPNFTTN